MKKQTLHYALFFLLAGALATPTAMAQGSGTQNTGTQNQGGQGQQQKASPAAKASGKIGEANVTVNYSSPSVKQRKIWGELVPYGKVWRAGANEATTLETDKDLTVEGKVLPAGKYTIFAIPGENQWTIIFNKQTGQWGTRYDETQDALRVTAKPVKSKSFNERLAYEITPKALVLRWENMEVPVNMSAKATKK